MEGGRVVGCMVAAAAWDPRGNGSRGVAPAVGPTGGRPPTFLRDKEKEERGGSGGETLHYPAVE